MSKKSKSTTGPSKFAQPFIRQGADALSNAYQSNQSNIQQQTDNTLGMLNPFLQERLQEGNAGVNAAQQYGVDVLAGNYLNNNPHLQSVIDMTNADVADAVNAQMGLKGLTGGSNHAGVLGKQISQNTANLRYGDYARERGAMDSAASRSGQLASAEYLPVQGMLQSLQASTMPLQAAGMYAGGLGGLLGGYQSQSGRPGMDLFGTAAQLGSAALMASERRVKKNVTKTGTLPDGLNTYSFNYTWDDEGAPLYHGVMVDEVRELRPWALGPVVDGIQTVDYSKLEAR